MVLFFKTVLGKNVQIVIVSKHVFKNVISIVPLNFNTVLLTL